MTVKGLTELNVASSTVFEAMVAFSWFQFWTKCSDEVLKHMLEVATSVIDKDETIAHHIAEAHLCLGLMYRQLCRCSEA